MSKKRLWLKVIQQTTFIYRMKNNGIYLTYLKILYFISYCMYKVTLIYPLRDVASLSLVVVAQLVPFSLILVALLMPFVYQTFLLLVS